MPAWLAWGAISGKLKAVPVKVWLEIGAVLLSIVLVWHHLHKVYQDGYAAGVAHQLALDKRAEQQATKKAAKTTSNINAGTQKVEVRYVQTVRTIHDTANVLRMRGPRAVHVNMPSYHPTIGGPDAASQGSDGIGLATIEIGWPELVDHAEQCDVYRAQVMGLQDYITLVQKYYSDFQRQNQPANSPIPGGR